MATRKTATPAKPPAARRKPLARAVPGAPAAPHTTDALLSDLREMILQARQAAAVAVNLSLTMLYWRVGRRIREDVLGAQRADYGEQIVATLSRQLSAEFGPGCAECCQKPGLRNI